MFCTKCIFLHCCVICKVTLFKQFFNNERKLFILKNFPESMTGKKLATWTAFLLVTSNAFRAHYASDSVEWNAGEREGTLGSPNTYTRNWGKEETEQIIRTIRTYRLNLMYKQFSFSFILGMNCVLCFPVPKPSESDGRRFYVAQQVGLERKCNSEASLELEASLTAYSIP